MSQQTGPEENGEWAHPIRAVAFDMDGLMVNTEDLYTEVGETILARRGRKFTAELKRRMMGLPGDQAFQMMIDAEQLEATVEELSQESDAVFEELLPKKLAVLPGLIELLDLLDEQSIPRCVATSSKHYFARQVLQIVELSERFNFVVTAEDVTHGKPAPDIYQEAARRMQVVTANLLVLEDSHHGSRAGIAAGACTVAVPGEHSQDHDFSGVHYRADSLKDALIVRLVGG